MIKNFDARPYTGLQVTSSPGLPLVWVGCSLLIVGMVAAFTLRRPPKKRET
jgi:cytochrome c biogenesis protein ResB